MLNCAFFIQALSGRAEKANRHGAFPCVEVTPKSKAVARSEEDGRVVRRIGWFRRAFCTGGVDPDDPRNPEDNKEHAGMVFFRDYVGVVLSKPWVKVKGENIIICLCSISTTFFNVLLSLWSCCCTWCTSLRPAWA